MKKAEYGLTGDFIFKEAVEFLKKKIPLKLGEYREISDECKGKAFTVSGYTSLEVLQKFLDELTEACEQGKTKKDFGLSTLFQTNFFRLFFRYCTGV